LIEKFKAGYMVLSVGACECDSQSPDAFAVLLNFARE
jgi:hypothetical protein